jgi:hypothetical protein
MASFKFLGAQAACGINVGAASTFEDATEVRLMNTAAAEALITIANAADVTLATFSLESLDNIVVKKNPTDQIFAAAVTVVGTPCNVGS